MNRRYFGPKHRRFRAGDTVISAMGVRRVGVVSASQFSPSEWTDGTYRQPLTAAERRDSVPVEWADGTRGWTFAEHIEHHTPADAKPTGEPPR